MDSWVTVLVSGWLISLSCYGVPEWRWFDDAADGEGYIKRGGS